MRALIGRALTQSKLHSGGQINIIQCHRERCYQTNNKTIRRAAKAVGLTAGER